jgi:hypothetical protein
VAVSIPTSVTSIGFNIFYECRSLAAVSIPTSVTSIEPYAFEECNACTTLLVQPADAGAAAAANVWSTMLDMPAKDSGNAERTSNSNVVVAPWLPGVTRVWAPDAIIALLTGPFTASSTFGKVPRGMRAAPCAKMWAAVQLWVWWSPPTGAGFVEQDRVVCRPRVSTLFSTMLAGLQAANAESLPLLPQELWVVIFGFLKHNRPPTYLIGWK